MSGFATCLELINVRLPPVNITGRIYYHEDQMNLILDILNYQKDRPDGDYCGTSLFLFLYIENNTMCFHIMKNLTKVWLNKH